MGSAELLNFLGRTLGISPYLFSQFPCNLKSNCVSLVGEVHSGNSGVDSLSDLITDIDGSLKSSEESLSVLVLIELEVVVLLVEVDVLVLAPPFTTVSFFLLFIFIFTISLLLCSHLLLILLLLFVAF